MPLEWATAKVGARKVQVVKWAHYAGAETMSHFKTGNVCNVMATSTLSLADTLGTQLQICYESSISRSKNHWWSSTVENVGISEGKCHDTIVPEQIVYDYRLSTRNGLVIDKDETRRPATTGIFPTSQFGKNANLKDKNVFSSKKHTFSSSYLLIFPTFKVF